MKLVLERNIATVSPLDRRLQWYQICFILLGLTLFLGAAVEVSTGGLSDGDIHFVRAQLQRLSTWSVYLLELTSFYFNGCK